MSISGTVAAALTLYFYPAGGFSAAVAAYTIAPPVGELVIASNAAVDAA